MDDHGQVWICPERRCKGKVLKKLLNQGVCLFSSHEGKWEYEHPKPRNEYAENCTQNLVCDRCGGINRRTKHVEDRWEYETPNQCNQVKRCKRCGAETRSRIQHYKLDWEYWYPKPENKYARNCEQKGICERCGAEAGSRDRHRWDKRGIFGEKRCSRCGQRQESDYDGGSFPADFD